MSSKIATGIIADDYDCIYIPDIPEEQPSEYFPGHSSLSKTKYLVGTQKRTIRDVKFIKDWLSSKGHPFDLENMEPARLNSLLEFFYREGRTKDNKMFTRRSLSALRASLNRHLLALTPGRYYRISIMKDPNFLSSNKVLDEKFEEEKFREKIPKWKPISDPDLVKLMTSEALCIDNPLGLQRKVWLDLTLHFGIKGIKATWSLTKESFLLETDTNGKKYYCLNQDLELSKQEIYSEIRDWYWNSRMYEIPDRPHCPVHSLSLYLSKLGKNDNDFFQRPYDAVPVIVYRECWYRGPLGHQVISKMMSDVSKVAGLSSIYTNTCVRATLVQLLENQGLDLDMMFHIRNKYSTMSAFRQSAEELDFNSRCIHDVFYKACYESGSTAVV